MPTKKEAVVRHAVLALQQVEAEDDIASGVIQLLRELEADDPLNADEALVCFAFLASPQSRPVVELLCRLAPFLVTADLMNHPATQQPILSGLCHPSQDVQLATLKQLATLAATSGLAALCPELVITAVASLAAGDSVLVWQAAARVLVIEASRGDPSTSSLLFSDSLLRLLTGEQGSSSSQSLRALELYGQIAAGSDAGFARCAAEGGQMEVLLQVWHGSDILSQLSALELIGTMCSSALCFQWFAERSLFVQLVQVLDQPETMEAAMLTGGVLRALSTVVHHSAALPAQIQTTIGLLLPRLLALSGAAEPESSLALLLLGRLSARGQLLDDLPLPELGALIADKLAATAHATRSAAMNALAELLSSSSAQLQQLVQQHLDMRMVANNCGLVLWLGRQSAHAQQQAQYPLTVAAGAQPDSELQLSAWAALAALVQHQWGTQMVLNTAGAAETLLNRKCIGLSKEANEWRYDAVVGMLKFVSDFPSTELGVAFRKYQQQGPFARVETK